MAQELHADEQFSSVFIQNGKDNMIHVIIGEAPIGLGKYYPLNSTAFDWAG